MRNALGLLMLLVACGDDAIHHLADAPPVITDTPVIDSGIDAALQPVTLTIKSDSVPVAGIAVYFQNADSTVVSSTTTDASGVASAVMQPGGFVTAVNPFVVPPPTLGTTTGLLKTFAGVKPGDHLVLNQTFATAPAVNVTITIPEDVGANFYQVYSTCGNIFFQGGAAPAPTTLPLYGCNGTADLVVASYQNSVLDKVIIQSGVAMTEGAAITIAGPYQPLTAMTFEYTNVPAGFTGVDVKYLEATPNGLLEIGEQRTYPQVITGSATGAMPVAEVPGAVAIEVINPTGNNVSHGNHYFVRWGAVTATHTFDIAAKSLVDFVSTAAFDVATATIVWTPATSGVTPEFDVARVYGYREATSPQFWNWDLATPYAAGQVKYPVLPADAATYNVLPTDIVSVSNLLTAKVPGGYDVVRAHVLDVDVRNSGGLVVGPTGEIEYVVYDARTSLQSSSGLPRLWNLTSPRARR